MAEKTNLEMFIISRMNERLKSLGIDKEIRIDDQGIARLKIM